MSSTLIEFTDRALSKGLERDDIAQALRAAGWPKDEVAAALNGFAETDFPLPVPKPKPQVSARETFVQLLFFTSLYTCTWSFISLIFTFIDRSLPNLLNDRGDLFVSIRLEISTLVVLFTILVFLSLVRVDVPPRQSNRGRSHAPRVQSPPMVCLSHSLHRRSDLCR